MDELLEKLAELEHNHWMTWVQSIMESEPISDERRERWLKYCIPYEELPDDIKEYDRK